MSSAETRLLHLHIEKTGGTALRFGLQRALGREAKMFRAIHEEKMAGIVPDEWDLISGHFGYTSLAPLGGRMVVLLRDPVERFLSAYYYWRQMHEKGVNQTRQTLLASKYSLDDFVLIRDEVPLIEQFANQMTWQLADTFRFNLRQKLRSEGVTDTALLALAVEHLRACQVIGVLERLDAFTNLFQRVVRLPLRLDRLNVTEARPSVSDISPRTRARILDWVYLDIELHQAACVLAAAR
jgi:hypothetical protein